MHLALSPLSLSCLRTANNNLKQANSLVFGLQQQRGDQTRQQRTRSFVTTAQIRDSDSRPGMTEVKMVNPDGKKHPLVSELLLSHGPHVKVNKPDKVEQVLARMRAGGPERLQVLADFDMTLTRVHRDGKKLECSWGVMESSPLLPASYTERTAAVKAKYLPIEHDSSLTVQEKIPHMEAWYREANGLLREAGVNRSMFPEMVKAANVELREGTQEMMDRLRSVGAPVLVLSAGLGDLLTEILVRYDCLPADNVKVVSNFLHFDPDGRVHGIDGEMIHMFNKSESAIHDSEYFDKLKGRDSVLLLGDSLGDLQMSKGCSEDSALLTVGFLNVGPGMPVDENRLRQYQESFDVVLVDDQTMGVPASIVTAVLGEGKRE